MTRTRPGASATGAAIAARGFIPILAPLLTIRSFTVTPRAATQALIVASANALPALPLQPCRILAVGDATAAQARALGHTDVLSAAGDATALLRLARETLDPRAGPLLLAAGAGQGHALATALGDAGFTVDRQDAYAADPVAALPAPALAAIEAGLHAAMFLSAEAARIFTRLLPPALAPRVATTHALAIGAPAALALHGLAWRSLRIASRPTLEEVLTLL